MRPLFFEFWLELIQVFVWTSLVVNGNVTKNLFQVNLNIKISQRTMVVAIQ